MLGLLRNLEWETVKSPLFFVSGMLVGVILVAIIWYIVQLRKAHEKRQQEAGEESSQQEGEESEIDPEGNFPTAIIVADAKGDYLMEDKSQLGGIIDFKKVPRRESERQTARRELVITMLIAESMSK